MTSEKSQRKPTTPAGTEARLFIVSFLLFSCPIPSIVRKEESGDHAYDKLFW